jgi:ribosomal protein S18 acetylase RimI-like enzyme
MLSVRSMTPTDYPAVAAISADAVKKALVGLPFWESAEEIAATVRRNPQAVFVVAVDEQDTILGFAGYDLKTDGEARIFGPLVTVARHGIGNWLSSQIESIARPAGAQVYSKLIGLGNGSGIAWAEWRGYQLDSEFAELLFTFLYPGELTPPATKMPGMVRRAVPADLERIYQLYQTCFPAGSISLHIWQSWLKECWVVELDGEIRGILRLEHETAFLHHLCVESDFRRHGLGAHLISVVAKSLWRENPVRIGLTVRLDNTAAVSLFRSVGFRSEIPVAKWMKRED